MLTNRTLRFIALLSVISLSGLVLIQLYWVRKAHYLSSEQFGNKVTLALLSVAGQINKYNNDSTSIAEPVQRINDATFSVNIFGTVSSDYLQNLLQVELGKYGISQGYRYAIYDCFLDSIQWYAFEKTDQNKPSEQGSLAVPPVFPNEFTDGNNHFFIVHFPNWNSFVFKQMGLMALTTFGLLIVMGIFTYLVFVIFKQKRLNEIREDFINNMTHEFKTPIATMTLAGNALCLDKTAENPTRVKRYGNIVLQESTRLKTQVENILKVAVLDSTNLAFNKESINIHEIITNTVKNFDLLINECGGTINLNLTAPNSNIIGDNAHLTNLFFNLIDNAIKYKSLKPIINITSRQKSNSIVITLSDNGPGIPLNAQKQVFDKFYRVPTGNIHNVKGFGLGLSYVKKIVILHGGKIKLISSPNEGTTFVIKFNATPL